MSSVSKSHMNFHTNISVSYCIIWSTTVCWLVKSDHSFWFSPSPENQINSMDPTKQSLLLRKTIIFLEKKKQHNKKIGNAAMDYSDPAQNFVTWDIHSGFVGRRKQRKRI